MSSHLTVFTNLAFFSSLVASGWVDNFGTALLASLRCGLPQLPIMSLQLFESLLGCLGGLDIARF